MLEDHVNSDSESECHEISCILSENSDISSRSVTPSSARSSNTPSSSFAESSCGQSLSSTVNVALVAQIQHLELERTISFVKLSPKRSI